MIQKCRKVSFVKMSFFKGATNPQNRDS